MASIFRRLRYRNIFIALLIVLVLGVVGAEVVLRLVIGLGDPPLYVTSPTWEYGLKPGVYHRFRHTISVNRFMMRSPEIAAAKSNPREFRLLVLGDSIPNGGAATPDDQLATTYLQPLLAADLQRDAGDVKILNISCGSWGPTNLLAYVNEFGTFDADAAVIVLNSVDWGDEPTFALTPEQPTRKPFLALEEVLTNYGPRALGHQFGPGGDDTKPTPANAEKSLASLRELVARLRARNVRVSAVLHLRQSEMIGTPYPGHDHLAAQLRELNVPIVESKDFFLPRRAEWPKLWRDDIHPNREGQPLLAEVFRAAAKKAME